MQSELLTKFYQAYAGWLDAGAPDKKPFIRSAGLCWNLCQFCNIHRQQEEYPHLLSEMIKQFKAAGLNDSYPFNRMDSELYTREGDFQMIHLNEQRIKWVRDHAQQ